MKNVNNSHHVSNKSNDPSKLAENSYVTVTSDDDLSDYFNLRDKRTLEVIKPPSEEILLEPERLNQQNWVSQTESPNGFHRGMIFPFIPKITTEIIPNNLKPIELNVISGPLFFNDF